jgi:CheY-like chemotaxis protein
MRFEQTLDVQSFCAEAVALRMLVVDNDPLIRRLVRHHLEKLGVAVKAVEDGRKGVDEALAGLYDCVLMDVDMPVLDGIAALAELRKRGYCGLVIAATAVSGPENEERIRTAGFDECVKKPLTPESLNELLDRFSDDPICSTLARQPGMAGMINAFVDGLATSCREIEKALVESDFKLLGRIARQIKADTGSLGFEAVSEASGKLEELAHAGADPDAVRTQLRVLLQLCTRVRPAHD